MRLYSKNTYRFLFLLSGILFISGIIVFSVFLFSGINKSINSINIRVTVPGVSTVNLSETGKYTIYLESKGDIDEQSFYRQNNNDLNITVKNIATGQELILTPASGTSRYSFNGLHGKSIYTFKTNQPGKYGISGSYKADGEITTTIAIGTGFAKSIIFTVLPCILILLISIGASIALLVFTIIRMKKQQLFEMSQPNRYSESY